MSKIIELARAIDEELINLQNEICDLRTYSNHLQNQLDSQKEKNRSVAKLLRVLASDIEGEEYS
jgi:peptidoglycan hydrolase CwlO-like protein